MTVVESADIPARSGVPCVVVMGVSGTGKTTTARLLALRLGVPFADADDLHPRANIAKMASGVPLDDSDREPWLASVGDWLRTRAAAGTGGVIACSALKRRYRDLLRDRAPGTYFLLLTADRDDLLERIAGRAQHFMPSALLDSQLAALEPLQPGERGVALHGSRDAEHAVDAALRSLRDHTADRHGR
ncbi:gluconokinase [Nocardia jinanensis]|uniref:Gluconokinase n=1 Tax=Nocardia jinanensis TaxID=382504 RepID=A0A917VNN5_9NOCA|nr:gluconokinase [Nocardia jinanensis]GGK99163.1 gluconokinase [Nocardia jinanensis]